MMPERAESSSTTSSCTSSSPSTPATKENTTPTPKTAPRQPQQESDQTLYLCNFRVSVDGDWLCLKEMAEAEEMMAAGNCDNGLNTPEGVKERKSFPTTPEFEDIVARYPDYPKGKKKERDATTIERSNLINILQLVIKEVVDSSMKFGRQLDSDHIPLQHFFIVMEHILKHGFQPKKALIGHKKELWDLLQHVERRRPDAADITASVRDLPTVKSGNGRARAWLRLALMQKRLGDYLGTLITACSGLLPDFYETTALLRSTDEAAQVVGLVTSLNVVDCNICVKEEDLDGQPGVIDFSLYLRSRRGCGGGGGPFDHVSTPSSDGACSSSLSAMSASASAPNIAAVLDQKSYLEDLNRQLSTTVNNLESKVEGLTTTNALMKEDLSISRKELLKKQQENKKLLEDLRKSGQETAITATSVIKSSWMKAAKANEDFETPQDVAESRDALQKELGLQMSMKAEMEMAIKLLEKDVNEKQGIIGNLRGQLDEIKDINLDMYVKLQECETELSQKGLIVAKLEEKTQAISRMLMRLNTEPGRQQQQQQQQQQT